MCICICILGSVDIDFQYVYCKDECFTIINVEPSQVYLN